MQINQDRYKQTFGIKKFKIENIYQDEILRRVQGGKIEFEFINEQNRSSGGILKNS